MNTLLEAIAASYRERMENGRRREAGVPLCNTAYLALVSAVNRTLRDRVQAPPSSP